MFSFSWRGGRRLVGLRWKTCYRYLVGQKTIYGVTPYTLDIRKECFLIRVMSGTT
jgi:hypothetical protein